MLSYIYALYSSQILGFNFFEHENFRTLHKNFRILHKYPKNETGWYSGNENIIKGKASNS